MRIEALEESGHIRGRWLVHLSDGNLIRVTENEVVSFRLAVGMELEEDALSALQAAGAGSNARDLAAKLIGHRPQSRRELLDRLKKKGIAEQDALDAADWLEDLGALDDAAYACTVVRYYSQRGYGRKKLESELYRRGVPKDCWEDAMREAEPAEDGIARFLSSKLRGRDPNDPKEIKRVSDALLRRGYSWNEIRNGLLEYGSRIEEDDAC